MSDLDFWLSGVEAQLSSSDTGRDLGGAQTLLKKQQLLEADITAHQVTPLNLETGVHDSLVGCVVFSRS